MVHLVVLPVEVKLLSSLAVTVSSKGQSPVCPASDSFNALLRIVPRTGAIVTEIEFHKMRHVFHIRAELEDLAGRLAAENINHTQLNGIGKLVQACKKLAKMPQNSRKRIELDLKFRDILYEAADNPVLKDQSQHLYHCTLRLTATLFNTGDWSDLVQMSHDEYKEIHQALPKKDVTKAGDLR